MKKYIGFIPDKEKTSTTPAKISTTTENVPRKSVVRVHFPQRNMTLSYYNDSFDLHRGDLVYVDGKLEGMQGEVIDVNYSFKIKLSDYKRVIAVADTSVKGQLHICGSHLLTFDEKALPYDKVKSWFCAPGTDSEYVVGDDPQAFPLDDLHSMGVSDDIAKRGYDYYMNCQVCYLCVDGGKGRAIVEGSQYYDVEFTYKAGEISNLVCSCFCSYTCKHEFAAMLQLTECLKSISKDFKNDDPSYFAAVSKAAFVTNILRNKTSGSLIVDI